MLYQHDAEVLFPARVIPSLRSIRGSEWDALIERVSLQPESDPDVLAFGLMMIRLGGCLPCSSDSYRALHGCTHCAQHTVARYKGSDADLIEQWQTARKDILSYLSTGVFPQDQQPSPQ